MQWLARVCVERPIFALMLILAVVVAGVTSYQQLGIDRFPNIDLPTIRVQTTYPGAASAEVESEVTQPLEDAVATVAGLDELRSISNDDVSMLMLTFRLDQNINVAAQDVRDAISARAEPPAARHRPAHRAEAGPRRLADHVDRGLRAARHARAVFHRRSLREKHDRVGPRRRAR